VRANESMRINDQFHYPALHVDNTELILNFHSSMISSFLNLQDGYKFIARKYLRKFFLSKAQVPKKLDIQGLHFGGSTDNVENRRVQCTFLIAESTDSKIWIAATTVYEFR